MTLAHQDIRERLVDYLFGELDEGARAAFDEHLAGCESCRVTVEATAKARAVAREVVRAPLDEPVPLGVRSRVLAAAAAAAEERRTAASTTTVAAAAAAAIAAAGEPPAGGGSGTAAKSGSGDLKRERAESPRRGWFDWLRGRWAFPTLATVAAMAAFFVVRGTILREARHPLDEATSEKLALPSTAPATGSETEAQRSAPRETEKAQPEGDAVQGQLAPGPAAKGARDDRKRAIADEAGDLGKGTAAAASGAGADRRERGARAERSPGKAPASSAPVRHASKTDSLDRLANPSRGRLSEREEAASLAAKPTAAKPSARKEDSSSREARRERAPQKAEAPDEPLGFSTPPPPAPAAPPAGRPAAPVAPAARPAPEAPSGAAEAPSTAPAEAREESMSRAGGARRADKKAKERNVRTGDEAPAAESAQDDEQAPAPKARVDRTSAPAPTTASAPAPAASAGGSAAAAPDPARALAQRADQLLAARRWPEASAAYRDLLRQFPHHPSATQWRARLAAADRAAAAADAGAGSTGFAAPPPPR